MLLSTLKLDSLQLMSKKTKSLFVATIIFFAFTLVRFVIAFFIGLPQDLIDNDTNSSDILIRYVQEPNYYCYTQLFLFLLVIIYFEGQLVYLDSILASVEGSSTSAQGSLYVAASKHIE